MFIRIIFFLFVCSCLSAQEYISLSIGQWLDGRFIKGASDSDGYSVIDFVEGVMYKERVPYAPLPGSQEYPEGANRVIFNEATGKYEQPRTIATTIGQSRIFFVNGEIYSVVKGGKPDTPGFRFVSPESDSDGATPASGDAQADKLVSTMELLTFTGGQWHTVAGLRTDSLGAILPLGNGDFLVGLRDGHIVDENKHDPNPFAIYRKNSRGELNLRSVIDFGSTLDGIDRGVWVGSVATAPSDIAITDGHYTFISNDTGTIWVFSSHNGRLVRSRALYPDVLESLRSKRPTGSWGPVVPVITGAQPTIDGRILISAWGSKLGIEGLDLFAETAQVVRNSFGQMTFQEIDELYNKSRNSLLALDPIVRWYRYDPVDGQLTREPHGPEGSRDTILSREEFMQSRYWLTNEDGTKVFYIDNETLFHLIPGQRKKISADEEQVSLPQ